MAMSLSLVTGPAAEPLTTAEAKAHLRVDFSTDDTLIDALVVAARRHVEHLTGRALINQTWDLKMDGFPGCGEIRIPKGPLSSVTSISYTDTAGASQTWGASNYIVDTASDPPRIALAYGVVWPSVRAIINPVTVRFVAGYGATSASIPADILAALKLILGDLYENREETQSGGGINRSGAVDRLLASHRLPWFGV